ncbi:MAG TPA: hypothetical protein PLF84_17245 [Bryobacteraceae bacterium]|nr:hypothetical protein [Bryobacteraceae bacterium]
MVNVSKIHTMIFVLTIITISANAQTGMPSVKGGSNFNTYGQARCFSPPPSYEQWNPVVNFDIDSMAVSSTLQVMRSTLDPTNGNAPSVQESIRINVFHIRGGERCQGSLGTRGINLDSDGGGLSPTCFWNLRELVSEAASKGYKQILVGLHPQGRNNPYTWPLNWQTSQFYMSYFSENWNFINEVRCAVREGLGLQCGGTSLHPTIAYRIDLFNEGSFYQHQQWPGVLLYTQYVWGNYFSSWGKADTVGFSIAA